jgi:HlyD family secretion protein
MANREIAARPAVAGGAWYDSLPRSTKFPTVGGILILAVALMGFGVWGNMAPIAGAVVASGVFVATGQNKIIQHFEGGIIREIYVREGDVVEQGQVLLDLDDTAARAEQQRLFLRRVRLSAIDARLQAEMREEPEIRWPDDVTGALTVSPEAKEIIESQKMTFTARRNYMNSDIKSIDESIKALDERIQKSRVQLDAVKRQIVLLDEEIATKQPLLQAGLVGKPELMVLHRSKANLEGEVGRVMGEIGDAKERIARAIEQINGVRKTAIKTAVEQMHEVRGELADVRERMLSAKGMLDRVRITAPVGGVVVKLRYHTRGGVVESWSCCRSRTN